VCDSCLASITFPDPPSSCSRCGQRLNGEQSTCTACRQHPPAYDSACSWAIYTGVARTLVHLLKYEQVLPLARYLARQLHQLPLPEFDTVVPVPLGRQRRRERGYNQAEEVARHLARLRGCACSPEWLRRRKETRSQAGLDASQREHNVRDAFTALRTARLREHRILLLDDVLTTGATARAAAAALKAGGARQVHLLTVARADLERISSSGDEPANLQAEWEPNPWRSNPRQETSC
jgi:ComF family protein